MGGAVPPQRGRVEHDGRRRLLGLGPERLGQRLHELAQGGLRLGRDRRRRAGDEEEGAGFGGGEPAEIGAGAADERPAAAPPGLGVHRDPGDRQRLEVAPGGADRHFELLGHLGGGHPAPGLEEQEGGDEPVCTHGSIIVSQSGQTGGHFSGG